MSDFWNQLPWRLGIRGEGLSRFPIQLASQTIVSPAYVRYQRSKSNDDSYFVARDEIQSLVFIAQSPTDLLHFETELEPLLDGLDFSLIDAVTKSMRVGKTQADLATWLDSQGITDVENGLSSDYPKRPTPTRALRLPECLFAAGFAGRPELLAGEAVVIVDLSNVSIAQATLENVLADAALLGFGQPQEILGWQVVNGFRVRILQETSLEIRLTLSALERRIVFELPEISTKLRAGLLTMILSRGLNYKTELIDQKIPLAARLESIDETTFLMTQIASDLLALKWLEPDTIQGLMQKNKHGYLFLDFPIQAGFREWYYGF